MSKLTEYPPPSIPGPLGWKCVWIEKVDRDVYKALWPDIERGMKAAMDFWGDAIECIYIERTVDQECGSEGVIVWLQWSEKYRSECMNDPDKHYRRDDEWMNIYVDLFSSPANRYLSIYPTF